MSGFSESGCLIRIGTIWPMVNNVVMAGRLTAEIGPTLGNIKVTYVSGHLLVPDHIQLAVATLVARYLTVVPTGGQNITEETLGRWSYKTSDRVISANGMTLPADIVEMLKQEKEIVF